MDGTGQYDDFFGTRNDFHLVDDRFGLYRRISNGACSEQLWSECAAHVFLVEEPLSTCSYIGTNIKSVWRWSVYLFDTCGEWCHELCLDCSCRLHDCKQQRHVNRVEYTKHLYHGHIECTSIEPVRWQRHAQCIVDSIAGNSCEHYGRGFSLSEPNRRGVYNTGSNRYNPVVGSA